MRRDNSSEHDHEQDGDAPERTWRKQEARLDRVRLYLATITAGLACAASLAELLRMVFNH